MKSGIIYIQNRPRYLIFQITRSVVKSQIINSGMLIQNDNFGVLM